MTDSGPNQSAPPPSGPLSGLKVVEFAGIGPGPHCAMLLSDLGADVLRIDRPGGNGWANPVVDRGRAVKVVDIRTQDGCAESLSLMSLADVVIEGFRPGVMERLGLGPDVALDLNPRLIYGRITGWGQTGPLANQAGHDINYIALTGALAGIGRPGETATPPLNLVGDFGGGSMFLTVGILSALLERTVSGRGQVIDAAIVDGTSHLMSMFSGLIPSGQISMERDRNLLGGAAPFYRCYLCSDQKEISVGALEPHFYKRLIEAIGADPALVDRQYDHTSWSADADQLAAIFATRTSDDWCALLSHADCCFAPVLTLSEAAANSHIKARNIYSADGARAQVAPAPRFSRTPSAAHPPSDAAQMIQRWRSSPARPHDDPGNTAPGER